MEKTFRLDIGKYFIEITIDNYGDDESYNYINLEFACGVLVYGCLDRVMHYALTHPFGDKKLMKHWEWVKQAYRQ